MKCSLRTHIDTLLQHCVTHTHLYVYVHCCTVTTTRDTSTAVEITDHLALSSGIIAAVLSVTSNEQAIGIGESLVQVLEF
jgi:GTP-dependent phosphoenolpyruvate carboxykinase